MEVKKTTLPSGQEIETIVLDRGHGTQDYTKVSLEKFVSTIQKTFDRGTMTEERANDALSDIFNDAVLATRDKNGPQGIFEGASHERDEIMKLVMQADRSYRDRLKDALPHINSLIVKTKTLMGELEQEKREKTAELRKIELSLELRRTMAETLRKVNPPFKLEANDTTRLHRLIEAFAEQKVYVVQPPEFTGGDLRIEHIDRPFNVGQDGIVPFVVRHDWAAVIGDSEGDKTGEALLPAPMCAFELRINAVNVIVLAAENKPTVAMLDTGREWFFVKGRFDLTEYCEAQVKAACIVLDAKVATHEVTQPPAKLNAKRVKSGKTPLAPYHTIDLNRRTKANASPHGPGDGTGTKRRLHFCRSHNRTYKESGKTIRIPWCLKGDPNIGIIDKHYKL